MGVLLSECLFSFVRKTGGDGSRKWRLTEPSPEETVKEDVEFLRSSLFFKGMQIVGLLQDTETGLLKEVVGVE